MNQMDDLMQKPVAWMHVMDNTEGLKANGTGIVSITQKRKQPFGKPGVDFSKSYPVTSTPLYTADQMREYAKKAVEAERVSLHITTEMLEAAAEEYDQWADENKGTYECIRAMLVKAIRAR